MDQSISYEDDSYHLFRKEEDPEALWLELVDPSFLCVVDDIKILTVRLPEALWNKLIKIEVPPDDDNQCVVDEMKAFREKKLAIKGTE